MAISNKERILSSDKRWGDNTRLVNPNSAREIILEVATQQFEEHGIDKTLMDDIAKSANISRRTLYRYFPQKSALIQAVVDIQAQDFLKSLKRKLPRKANSFSEKLEFYVRYAITEGPKAAGSRLLFSSKNSELAKEYYFNSMPSLSVWQDLIEPDFEEAQEQGEITSDITFTDLLAYLGRFIYIYSIVPSTNKELKQTIKIFVLGALQKT